jgi:hypothetical protein
MWHKMWHKTCRPDASSHFFALSCYNEAAVAALAANRPRNEKTLTCM